MMTCNDCIFQDTPARRELCRLCRPSAEEIVAKLREEYYDWFEVEEGDFPPHLNDWIRSQSI